MTFTFYILHFDFKTRAQMQQPTPFILRPSYAIAPNELVEYAGKKFTVQDFNLETRCFVLLAADGSVVEAYHREVKKIEGNSGSMPLHN